MHTAHHPYLLNHFIQHCLGLGIADGVRLQADKSGNSGKVVCYAMRQFTKQDRFALVQPFQGVGFVPGCHQYETCKGDNATTRQDRVKLNLDEVCSVPDRKSADWFEEQRREESAHPYRNEAYACSEGQRRGDDDQEEEQEGFAW